MVETPENKGSYDQRIKDEGEVLLLLLITNPGQYAREKGNIEHLVTPAGEVEPEDLERQRHDFLSFYHPGWTIDDLHSLLSYLEEHETDVRALREQHGGNTTEAADALVDLLS